MRRLVYAAGLIFMLGISIQIVLNLFEPGNTSLPAFLPYLAFVFMLLGPSLLLVTVVVALLPGEAKKMHSCEH
jgi:hypothetical protein